MTDINARQEDLDETRKMVRLMLHRLDMMDVRIRQLENKWLRMGASSASAASEAAEAEAAEAAVSAAYAAASAAKFAYHSKKIDHRPGETE